MSNKEKIISHIESLDMVLGCWDKELELLSPKELNKVIENIEFQSDTDVKIKRKEYVVEIDIVENEVDFNVLSKKEFIDRYGNERYLD